MKKYILFAIFNCALLLSHVASADVYQFDNTKQQQRFKQLSHSLRCLVCQNQDLSDSNAPLAADLRQQLYQQIRQGKPDQAILDYMTDRYGDFVLYKPPLKPQTYLLWFGPWLFLALGTFLLFRRRKL